MVRSGQSQAENQSAAEPVQSPKSETRKSTAGPLRLHELLPGSIGRLRPCIPGARAALPSRWRKPCGVESPIDDGRNSAAQAMAKATPLEAEPIASRACN